MDATVGSPSFFIMRSESRLAAFLVLLAGSPLSIIDMRKAGRKPVLYKGLFSLMNLEPFVPAACYLAPAGVIALFMRATMHRFVLFWLITLPGVAAHEICHFVAGGLTNAKPRGLSLWPSRFKDGYILGSVTFANLRWYNAAVACLAPILLLPLAIGYAYFHTLGGWHFEPWDLLRWYVLAGTLLSAWPSTIDWRLSFRSWPLAVAAFVTCYIFLNR